MKELSEIIDFLIQSGPDVNARYGLFGDGENVLRSLINYYKEDSNIENLVKILLEKGVIRLNVVLLVHLASFIFFSQTTMA